jgi:amidase
MQRIPRTNLLHTYERGRTPVARIRSGERILVETRTAFGEAELVQGVEAIDDESGADPLTGPIHVEDAEVGDALAIDIEHIELVGDPVIGPLRGCSALDWGPLPVDILKVREEKLIVGSLALPIRPMVGCIGVSPRAGVTPSTSVGDHGGNLDTRHIAAGARLFLPVFEPGAGLVLGDCHVLQGDGEMTGSPPETDAEVTIRVELVKGLRLARPRLMTADRFMTLASAETLEQACALAARDMVEALAGSTSLSQDEAYVALTLCGDLEISQVVNSWPTVRAAVDRKLFGL